MEIKNKYTRRIDREYNAILFEESDFGTDSNWAVKANIKPHQMQLANDYLVKEMTGASQNEVDEMEKNEYDKILEKINENRSKDSTEKKKQ